MYNLEFIGDKTTVRKYTDKMRPQLFTKEQFSYFDSYLFVNSLKYL
jgi:hypothetical protein